MVIFLFSDSRTNEFSYAVYPLILAQIELSILCLLLQPHDIICVGISGLLPSSRPWTAEHPLGKTMAWMGQCAASTRKLYLRTLEPAL